MLTTKNFQKTKFSDSNMIDIDKCNGYVRAMLLDLSLANDIENFNTNETFYISEKLNELFFDRHENCKISMAAENAAEIIDYRIDALKKELIKDQDKDKHIAKRFAKLIF